MLNSVNDKMKFYTKKMILTKKYAIMHLNHIVMKLNLIVKEHFMKYKILLTGRNTSTINDFFTQMDDCFELLTTSGRLDDISNHLKYFKPDIFVFCLSTNMYDSFNQMILLKRQFEYYDIPFVIIGTEEDCNNFSQYAVNVADLALIKPVTARIIRNSILDYMNTRQRLKKEAEYAWMESLKHDQAEDKKHILVVDDDPMMLKLIREYLHEKYDIATANSGKTALKFLQKKKTDLILLDYEMPVEDGPAVLQKLHANDATKDIPVVFLTGITEYGKIQKALVQKPQGYLLKPVDHDKLFETITGIIG